MTKELLMAVDSGICYLPATLPQEFVDAYQWTAMYANAVARTVSKDPNTEAYYNELTHSLQTVGWNILNISDITYDKSASTSMSPSDIIVNIVGPYLDQGQIQGGSQLLRSVLGAISTSPDTGVHDFCSFFWSKASPVKLNYHSMGTGALFMQQGMLKISMVYYMLDYQAEGWRSLFVSREWSSIHVKAKALTMTLNKAAYDAIAQTLIDKLSGKVKEHINTTPIDI